MKTIILLASLVLVTLADCNQNGPTKLKENDSEEITYSASTKYGYYIEVVKKVGDDEFNYNVQTNRNGAVMNVYKYPKNGQDSGAKFNGLSQFLATDTTDPLYGARFFRESIISFYSTGDRNFISSNHLRGEAFPVSGEEKKMFAEIGSLMKQRKLAFVPFDTAATLFWFKYNIR